jgi:hypothetical protein
MIGMTAIGDTPSDAENTYRRAEKVLLEEARATLRMRQRWFDPARKPG